MKFVIKHRLFISIVLFTLFFFLFFLYMDLREIMFLLHRDYKNNYIGGLFIHSWFLLIPMVVFFILMIVFTAFYMKKNKGMNKWITFSLTLFYELVFTFVYSMYALAPGFCFFPKAYASRNISIDKVKEVEVFVEDTSYTSLYYDNDYSEVTLLFVGNAQNAKGVFHNIKDDLDTSKRNLLIMDYPMFGYNYGTLNEETIYKEVDQYMSFLIEQEGYSYKEIRICGFSIGTGVATYCASKYKDVESLILFAPYYTFSDAMNHLVNVFHGPLLGCVRFKFPSHSNALNITCPTTIYYSDGDKIIPMESTLKLIACFKDCKAILVPNVSHNMVFYNKDLALSLLH